MSYTHGTAEPSAEVTALSGHLAVDVGLIRGAIQRHVDPLKATKQSPNWTLPVIESAIQTALDKGVLIQRHLQTEGVNPNHFDVHDPLFNLRKSVDAYSAYRTPKLYTFPADYYTLKKFLNFVLNVRPPRGSRSGPTNATTAPATGAPNVVPVAPVSPTPATAPPVSAAASMVIPLSDEDTPMRPPSPVPAGPSAAMVLDAPAVADAPSAAVKPEPAAPVEAEKPMTWADNTSTELPPLPDYSNKRPRLSAVPGFPSNSTATAVMNSVIYSEQVDAVLRNARTVASTSFDIGSESILRTALADQTMSIQLIVHKIHSLLQMHDLLQGHHRALTAALKELSQVPTLEHP